MIWILLTGIFGGATLVACVGWYLERCTSSSHAATIDELMDRVQAPDLLQYKALHPPEDGFPPEPTYKILSSPNGMTRQFVPIETE